MDNFTAHDITNWHVNTLDTVSCFDNASGSTWCGYPPWKTHINAMGPFEKLEQCYLITQLVQL